MNIIDQIEKEQLRNDITPFNIGDTVRVMVKVKEGVMSLRNCSFSIWSIMFI